MPTEFEYIVVGSGAGGGTLAARLAESGRKVLLLEAGGDPYKMSGGDPANPGADVLREDYEVPAFHALSTENEALRWSFFVRHYADTTQQKKDRKYSATFRGQAVDGVLYPRTSCLGGCTAHNAMINVYPHNDDWDQIATLTGDASWRAGKMRKYFQRIEDCRHRWILRLLAKVGINPSRHGFGGWLPTEVAIPPAALYDESLVKVLKRSTKRAFERVASPLRQIIWALQGFGDPNDWRLVKGNSYGLRYAPLTTNRHGRAGTLERLKAVEREHPGNLTIELNALVTRVLFDGKRATGVEYLHGERLYRAHFPSNNEPGDAQRVYATREVILAAGAFNTPQILMLSGIGPEAELKKHGIGVLVDLPGVGRNLQDRYEVGVINRMNFDHWHVLEGATYSRGDPLYRQWQTARQGVYTTNGAVMAAIKRSVPSRRLPDLFCFALLANFGGYYPDYSLLIKKDLNYLTWAVLKAHTNNTAGTVTLRSRDPRDTPVINFKYFQEGNDASGEDLDSVVEGVKFVRKLIAPLKQDTAKGPKLVAEEVAPGDNQQSDQQLREFVRDRAWGHHASCTCPIGPKSDPMAVLDSSFRVHGTESLRVVDASVFPRIPGFFIVSAIYMIGEKAADVILADAR